MNTNIEELIDINKLSNTIHYFYSKTGINLRVYDNKGIDVINKITLKQSEPHNTCSSFNFNETIDKNSENMKKKIIHHEKFIVEKLQNGLQRIKYNIVINSTKIGYIVSDYFFVDEFRYNNKCDKLTGRVPVVESKELNILIEVGIEYLENLLQVTYLKRYDNLTGVYNRDYFIHEVNKKLKELSCICVVLILHFDNINIVNSIYGYDVGNIVLKEACSRIKSCVKDDFILGRKDSEFWIFGFNIKGKDEVKQIVENIYEKFKQPIKIKEVKLITSFSTGINIFTSKSKKANEVINRAISAKYMAKENGENKYFICEDRMCDYLIQDELMSFNIRNSFENNEFEVYYQPLVDTYSSGIYGVEALLRWNNPEKGIIPPAKFIPIAEKSDFIVTLGKWVMEEACAQCKRWHDAGHINLIVSVNISQKQLKDDSFIDTVKEITRKTNLDPKYLCLEVTESQVMESPKESISKLKQIRQMGIKIALDDFGTGYSSLNYLRNIPCDIIKIDKSFVDNIPNDKYQKRMLEGMLQFMSKINKDVVVEGIETFEQLEFIQKNGFYKIQGFLISKPQRAKYIELLLDSKY